MIAADESGQHQTANIATGQLPLVREALPPSLRTHMLDAGPAVLALGMLGTVGASCSPPTKGWGWASAAWNVLRQRSGP